MPIHSPLYSPLSICVLILIITFILSIISYGFTDHIIYRSPAIYQQFYHQKVNLQHRRKKTKQSIFYALQLHQFGMATARPNNVGFRRAEIKLRLHY